MQSKIQHLRYVQPDALSEHLSSATYETVVEAVSRHVPHGARVLDVGSGRGELLKRLSEREYEVSGCDMDDKCVELGSAYGRVRKLAVEDISPEKFDGKFDCVVMSHVLEHVENPREAIKRVSTVLDGVMVLSVPNPYRLPNIRTSLLRRKIPYVNTGHLHTWDWPHFRTFLEIGCNHEVIDWFYDAVPLPLTEKSRKFLLSIRVLPFIENRLLRGVLPRFCRSVTAVTKPAS